MKSKSSSKTKVENGATSTPAKKRATTKRAPAKVVETSGIQKLLSGATPYALPAVGALATAALAATGYVLRKDVASFARGKAGSGLEEMLRMLHLERRSMHVFGAAGIFAGGLALGCLAGFFLVPRIVGVSAVQAEAPKEVNPAEMDGVAERSPTVNSVAHRSS